MAILSVHHLALIFGILGNIVSFMVFLAPVPTFYTIWKKKTSEGFQVIPYIVALFSATLLLYYAHLKTNALLIITINGIGCVIEITYLIIYLIYAPKAAKMFTLTLILLFNVGLIGSMMVFTILFFKGPKRVKVVGWFCASVNVAVFAAPLGIMRRVIKTKSVEFMPFSLSFFLTLCAVMWFFYGFLIRDFFIALPNVLGFIFGLTQIILYLIYKNAKKEVEMTSNMGHEETEDIKQMSMDQDANLYPHVNHDGDAKIKMIVDADDQSVESNENNV